jgi:hypothetical protein
MLSPGLRSWAQFLSQLMMALREVYLMPGEIIVQQNDMARELIFVTQARHQSHISCPGGA